MPFISAVQLVIFTPLIACAPVQYVELTDKIFILNCPLAGLVKGLVSMVTARAPRPPPARR